MTTSKSSRNRKSKGRSSAQASSYSQVDKTSASSPAAAAGPIPLEGRDSVDWQHLYGYVNRDLRKLLIVSGALFAAIIIIGFFL